MPSRVLIVEDNVAVGEATVELLRLRYGEHAVLVTRGREALRVAHDLLPDIVLVDVNLPDISGLDVARELRNDERFRDTLLVALSGYGANDIRDLALAAGFDEVATKPVRTDSFDRWMSRLPRTG